MSWDIFRAEYKQGLENNDDMAKVIAESYDKCVKTGMSGSGTAPPAPLTGGNVPGLQMMLKLCFSAYGAIPLSTSLDTVYIDAAGKLNETIDDTIDQFIDAFNTYHKAIVVTIAATPPLVSVGYNVT